MERTQTLLSLRLHHDAHDRKGWKSVAVESLLLFEEGEEDNIIDISSGQHHSAAITERGRIFVWGSNAFGQLGDGTTASFNHPKAISLRGNRTVVFVSCGGYHTAAITNRGELYCWGQGKFGQLGLGPSQLEPFSLSNMRCQFQQGKTDVLSPREVEGLQFRDILHVSCGQSHSAAVTGRRSVYTWGSNDFGQLGDGTSNTSKVPQLVAPLDNKGVRSVACGQRHTLAFTDDGATYCWGSGREGQLGNGLKKLQYSPLKIDAFVGTSLFKVVAGQGHMSAALSYDGYVYVWGGALQHDSGRDTRNFPHRLMDIPEASDVICGKDVVWVVTTSGSLYYVSPDSNGRFTSQLVKFPDDSHIQVRKAANGTQNTFLVATSKPIAVPTSATSKDSRPGDDDYGLTLSELERTAQAKGSLIGDIQSLKKQIEATRQDLIDTVDAIPSPGSSVYTPQSGSRYASPLSSPRGRTPLASPRARSPLRWVTSPSSPRQRNPPSRPSVAVTMGEDQIALNQQTSRALKVVCQEMQSGIEECKLSDAETRAATLRLVNSGVTDEALKQSLLPLCNKRDSQMLALAESFEFIQSWISGVTFDHEEVVSREVNGVRSELFKTKRLLTEADAKRLEVEKKLQESLVDLSNLKDRVKTFSDENSALRVKNQSANDFYSKEVTRMEMEAVELRSSQQTLQSQFEKERKDKESIEEQKEAVEELLRTAREKLAEEHKSRESALDKLDSEKERVNQLESQVMEWKSKCDEQEREVERLRNRLQHAPEHAAKDGDLEEWAAKDFGTLEEDIRKERKRSEELLESRIALEKVVSELKTEKHKLTLKVESLEVDLRKATLAKSAAEENAERTQQQLTSADRTLETPSKWDMIAENKSLAAKVARLEQDLGRCKEDQPSQGQEFDRVLEERGKLEIELQFEKQNCERLKAEVKSMKERIDCERDNALQAETAGIEVQTRAKEMELELEMVKAELSRVTSKLSAIQDSAESSEAEVMAVRLELGRTDGELKRLKEKYNLTCESLKIAEREVEQSRRRRMQSSEPDGTSIHSSFLSAASSPKLSAISARVAHMPPMRDISLEVDQQRLSDLEAEVTKLTTQISNKDNAIIQLRSDLSGLHGLEKKNADLSESLIVVEAQVADRDNMIRRLELSLEREKQQSSDRLIELEKELEKLERELESKTSELHAMRTASSAVEESELNTLSTIEDMRGVMDKQSREIQTVKSDNARMIAELQSATDCLAQVRGELESLSDSSVALEGKNRILVQEVHLLNEERNSLLKKAADLERDLDRHIGKSSELDGKVEILSRKLNSQTPPTIPTRRPATSRGAVPPLTYEALGTLLNQQKQLEGDHALLTSEAEAVSREVEDLTMVLEEVKAFTIDAFTLDSTLREVMSAELSDYQTRYEKEKVVSASLQSQLESANRKVEFVEGLVKEERSKNDELSQTVQSMQTQVVRGVKQQEEYREMRRDLLNAVKHNSDLWSAIGKLKGFVNEMKLESDVVGGSPEETSQLVPPESGDGEGEDEVKSDKGRSDTDNAAQNVDEAFSQLREKISRVHTSLKEHSERQLEASQAACEKAERERNYVQDTLRVIQQHYQDVVAEKDELTISLVRSDDLVQQLRQSERNLTEEIRVMQEDLFRSRDEEAKVSLLQVELEKQEQKVLDVQEQLFQTQAQLLDAKAVKEGSHNTDISTVSSDDQSTGELGNEENRGPVGVFQKVGGTQIQVGRTPITPTKGRDYSKSPVPSKAVVLRSTPLRDVTNTGDEDTAKSLRVLFNTTQKRMDTLEPPRKIRHNVLRPSMVKAWISGEVLSSEWTVYSCLLVLTRSVFRRWVRDVCFGALQKWKNCCDAWRSGQSRERELEDANGKLAKANRTIAQTRLEKKIQLQQMRSRYAAFKVVNVFEGIGKTRVKLVLSLWRSRCCHNRQDVPPIPRDRSPAKDERKECTIAAAMQLEHISRWYYLVSVGEAMRRFEDRSSYQRSRRIHQALAVVKLNCTAQVWKFCSSLKAFTKLCLKLGLMRALCRWRMASHYGGKATVLSTRETTDAPMSLETLAGAEERTQLTESHSGSDMTVTRPSMLPRPSMVPSPSSSGVGTASKGSPQTPTAPKSQIPVLSKSRTPTKPAWK